MQSISLLTFQIAMLFLFSVIHSLVVQWLFPLQIETKKLDFKEKAASKVGSKDNVTHRPGGGDKKVGQDLLPLSAM